MSPTSVKKTQQQFQAVLQQLEGKLLQLQARRETMDTRAFVVVEEVTTPPKQGGGGATLDEQPGLYHGEVGSLVATATDVLIKAFQIKLRYINDVLKRLSLLVGENPRQATPTDLLFSSYEEWLETNQQLFEFNSQLYELERVKFELKQKQERVKDAKESENEADSVVASELVHSSISQAQQLLTRLQHQSHSSHTTHTYIHELLNPRGGKMTLESQKVQEYVDECFQYAENDASQVRGVHRDRYQEFMAVLCSYIVEKQRNWQREDISHELVYSAVERCVMPRLKSLILPRVVQRERDELVAAKCHAFSAVTQQQLRVRPHLQSNEAVPFIDAITQLRASYFSSSPTDKMYSVVAAAKALYDRLGDTGESSIDGDAFLDLWIYVIIKANIKDLATNLAFMIDYGNPQLACGEAGYYLTTVEAAVHFIATLSPEILQTPQGQMEFVVCEREHFLSLCSLPGSGLELVTPETELQGYRVAVLREWALNRARLFRCALVPASYLDFAKVAVIRIKQEGTNPAMTQYLLKELRCEGVKREGLGIRSVPLGTAIVIDIQTIGRSEVLVLPTGDYDAHRSDLDHILQLERLGSLQTDTLAGDSCLIYQSPSQDLDIPISPPYYSGTRGSINRGADLCPLPRPGLGRSNETPSSSLWSPYVLTQNLSPAGDDNRVNEVSFTNQVAGMSIRSEHRRLRQSSRHIPDSIDTRNSPNLTASPSVHSRITTSNSGNSEITRSQSGNSEITDSQLPQHSASSELSGSIQGSHSVRPITITVEVEVHEDCIPIQPSPEHGRAKGREHCKDESDHFPSGRVNSASTGVDHRIGNSALVGDKHREEGSEIAQGNGGCTDTDPDSERNQSSWEYEGDPERVLTGEYRRQLEGAFVTNHLFGNQPQSVSEAARTITLQAQMYLQRLNYLSVSYDITGEYDDITLNAVKTFQRAHNHHEAKYSAVLLESGHLSPITYQFLRQAYITIYASMVRIGLEKHLGENFDPMSTAPRDMAVFRECVGRLQRSQGLRECQTGAMCANTTHRVKQLLHSKKSKSYSATH